MNDDDKNRLESLLAHQDRQIQDLSDMLINQRADMDKILRRLEKMEARLGAVEDSAGGPAPANEKPPHY